MWCRHYEPARFRQRRPEARHQPADRLRLPGPAPARDFGRGVICGEPRMTIRLIEVAPGKWRVDRPAQAPARSDLPLPSVISDIMPPTEQVDGKLYTSKSAFRAVGRALGLTEVGTEKFRPRPRNVDHKEHAVARRNSIRKAVEKFKAQ